MNERYQSEYFKNILIFKKGIFCQFNHNEFKNMLVLIHVKIKMQ